jgi:two-component system osmolarity sensor histidine kinase EnvZ
MAPIGSTISLRLVGFLLAAVVLFNLAMAVAVFGPINGSRNVAARLPLPRQMAAIVDVIDQAAPADRSRILTAVNSASLSVALVDELPVNPASSPSAPVLTRFLDRYDQAFTTRDLHVDLQRGRFLEGHAGRWSAVRLFVRLSDGKWVSIQPVRAALFNGFLWRGLIIVGLAGLLVILLLVIGARQTARPIERLAASARAFADKLDAPDLEEKGPKELRQLVAAFNDMKTRIRSLVHDRTRLMAAIAHDLRTYMTRLRLRAEFITDPVQRQRAEKDIEEMSELIGDTLIFARAIERPDAAPPSTDVATDVAAEVAAFVARRREVGDPVTAEGAPAFALPALIDAVALRRILANLTDNAIRYGRQAEIAVRAEAGGVVLTVADRGPGIPEAELDRIIAPFERLEPSRGRDGGGAGLGLAIVKALVEHQGGALRLANRPGGGLQASVTLRRAGGD